MNGSGFGWNLWPFIDVEILQEIKQKLFIRRIAAELKAALADPSLPTYLSPKMFPKIVRMHYWIFIDVTTIKDRKSPIYGFSIAGFYVEALHKRVTADLNRFAC